MKLHEEFNLVETLWDELAAEYPELEDNIVPETSSLTIAIGVQPNKKVLFDKAGISHREAYNELVKTIKTLSKEDLRDLLISWVADGKEPGDCAGDCIFVVEPYETWVKDRAAEVSKANGRDLSNPAERADDFRGVFEGEELGLPIYYYDFILGFLDTAYTQA